MNKELEAAWHRAREKFVDYDGVVGVGYGPKLRRGDRAADDAIVVLVEKKLRRDDVPAGQLIPKVFHDFPTDVRTPKLTIDSGGGDDGRPAGGGWCLTDYQWLAWEKVNEIWRRQQGHSEEMGDA